MQQEWGLAASARSGRASTQAPRVQGYCNPASHLSPPPSEEAGIEKTPLVSGTITMYLRRTGPSSEGVNCPGNKLWGIPGDSGVPDAQECEAQECAFQSSFPQTILVCNSSPPLSTPWMGFLVLIHLQEPVRRVMWKGGQMTVKPPSGHKDLLSTDCGSGPELRAQEDSVCQE